LHTLRRCLQLLFLQLDVVSPNLVNNAHLSLSSAAFSICRDARRSNAAQPSPQSELRLSSLAGTQLAIYRLCEEPVNFVIGRTCCHNFFELLDLVRFPAKFCRRYHVDPISFPTCFSFLFFPSNNYRLNVCDLATMVFLLSFNGNIRLKFPSTALLFV